MDISREELLLPLETFEDKHNIKTTRNDIPKSFLGVCPSRYYRFVSMDTNVLAAKVNKLLNKLYHKTI